MNDFLQVLFRIVAFSSTILLFQPPQQTEEENVVRVQPSTADVHLQRKVVFRVRITHTCVPPRIVTSATTAVRGMNKVATITQVEAHRRSGIVVI